MPRKTTKRPLLDLLSELEVMRAGAHPVDYLSSLISRRDGRWRFTRQEDRDRLEAMIASARETVLGLGRDALYGGTCYATIVQTPEGADVEFHRYPWMDDVEEQLRTGDLTVVDSETTGLHYRCDDRIVALAAVQVRMRGLLAYPEAGGPPYIPTGEARLHVKGAMDWLVDPEGRASTPEAAAVHGLDPAILTTCPTFAAQAPEIHGLLSREGSILVMHNAPFDMGFLRAEFSRCGMPELKGRVIDTRAVSKELWPDESASLDAMAARLGVEGRQAGHVHSALGDALLLASCLPPLLDAVRADLARRKAAAREAERKARSRSRT